MLSQKYTRLPGVQQKFVSFLTASFLIIILNSIILILFETSTAAFYMSMVLLHIILGLLILLPLIWFLVIHIMKMPLKYNRQATWAGISTAASGFTVLVSGILVVILGSSFAGGWVLWIHIASTILTVIAFFTHVSLKKGMRYHFLEWGSLWSRGIGQALRHPFSLTFLAGIVILILFGLSNWRFAAYPKYIEMEQQNNLAPAEAVLANNGFVDETAFLNSESCGQAGCHPDVYTQWNESVHHFSSFNNEYYSETVKFMQESDGVDNVRWCASCHDPAVLYSGRMNDVESIDMDHFTAKAGLTCLACHSTVGLRDVKGNGRYVLALPDEYPFARSQNEFGKWVHNTLVRAKPEPHRRAMLKPFQTSAEFCGSCHKVGVPPHINDYRWKRGQNQYDSWHASGVSGNTVRSFYLPAEPKQCADCHMPQVPSNDQGGDEGYIKSHRFPAANSTLPHINNFPEQAAAVQRNLSNRAVVLDIFQVVVNGEPFGPAGNIPALHPGDEVELAVVVRNNQVGHRFPAGTNDSNQSWVELQAIDQNGDPVLISGEMSGSGFVDSTAHFFNAVLVDKESNPIDKRNIQDWVATIYANTINPGTARVVHYRFTVPPGVLISRLQASLFYRKFKQQYNTWVFRENPPPPNQPVTVMSQATRQTGEIPAHEKPLWERWNDYGIGLFLETDTQGALRAFQRVAELAPGNPEGPINMARVYLAEGRLDPAADALAEAEMRQPGYLKTAYFRGELNKSLGNYEEALSDFKRVYEEYPKDRLNLQSISRTHYLMGNYEEALTWIDRLLEINPEAVSGLYNRMLITGALNLTGEYETTRDLYLYHREDEETETYTAEYKSNNPFDNREAQPIHYHELHPVTFQKK